MLDYIKEFRSLFFWRCVVAELLSSLFYCFAASSVTLTLYETRRIKGVLSPRWKDPIELIMVSLTMGLAIAAISFMFNIRHGGYINPAVVFGHFASWRNTFVETMAYFVGHIFGGIAGASLAYGLSNQHQETVYTVPPLHVSTSKGFVLEGFLTLVVVMVTLACTDKTRKERVSSTSIIYGCVVAMAHFIAIPYTGCILNPARIIGSAIIQNYWPEHVWIYFAGPLVGGIIAGLLYGILFSIQPPKNGEQTQVPQSTYIIEAQPKKPQRSSARVKKRLAPLKEEQRLEEVRHAPQKEEPRLDEVVFMNTNI